MLRDDHGPTKVGPYERKGNQRAHKPTHTADATCLTHPTYLTHLAYPTYLTCLAHPAYPAGEPGPDLGPHLVAVSR